MFDRDVLPWIRQWELDYREERRNRFGAIRAAAAIVLFMAIIALLSVLALRAIDANYQYEVGQRAGRQEMLDRIKREMELAQLQMTGHQIFASKAETSGFDYHVFFEDRR